LKLRIAIPVIVMPINAPMHERTRSDQLIEMGDGMKRLSQSIIRYSGAYCTQRRSARFECPLPAKLV
jgi:hypothetical protein